MRYEHHSENSLGCCTSHAAASCCGDEMASSSVLALHREREDQQSKFSLLLMYLSDSSPSCRANATTRPLAERSLVYTQSSYWARCSMYPRGRRYSLHSRSHFILLFDSVSVACPSAFAKDLRSVSRRISGVKGLRRTASKRPSG